MSEFTYPGPWILGPLAILPIWEVTIDRARLMRTPARGLIRCRWRVHSPGVVEIVGHRDDGSVARLFAQAEDYSDRTLVHLALQARFRKEAA